MNPEETNFDVGSFAAVINSRLAAQARIERAIAIGWLCGGYAIAFVLTGLGLAIAFYGYSFVNSVAPAAELSANAIADAFSRTELKTIVTGELSLAPESELKLASGQTVRLNEGATV